MKPRRAALVVDVRVESPLWKDAPGAPAKVRKAINAAADEIAAPEGEVAVLLADDATLRALNKKWRGIDKPTNVLSFPASPGARTMLGDIVIGFQTATRESRDEKKVFDHHVAHLAVHGFLHLMGYDHQNDSDADLMENAERATLARLRIPDPYRPRDPERSA